MSVEVVVIVSSTLAAARSVLYQKRLVQGRSSKHAFLLPLDKIPNIEGTSERIGRRKEKVLAWLGVVGDQDLSNEKRADRDTHKVFTYPCEGFGLSAGRQMR